MSVESPAINKFVFPQDEVNGLLMDKFQRVGGLELRDYFAAQAMTALIAISGGKNVDDAMEGAAKLCFRMADTMMRARGSNAQQANG